MYDVISSGACLFLRGLGITLASTDMESGKETSTGIGSENETSTDMESWNETSINFGFGCMNRDENSHEQ